ncbi:rhodanese-like domain-containing protein [Demequina soli]|uniref:rhodanese-like domain-containing protein n=1 Tax=Demequina soli TaxID=1638987 RepID=UPI0007803592|nr:rhodanese-like domain-containing protein [Demequina soli]
MTRTLRAASLAAATLLLATTLAACSADSGPVAFDGGHVSADRFAEAVAQDGVTVIDVRTPEEYAAGHLPGAVNIDVSATTFDAQVGDLDPAADYAVYCQSGNRSRAAIEEMAADGVEHTVGLDGGISAWGGGVVAD